ncbi:MAG: family 43 glycosylhydrolase, partial [Clostridia bacterium]|nr:family 43 glycosylhydrolase [Clostridia bacterium]
ISITGGIFNEVFQVAGGGNIPSGSRFSAVISGGLFKSGITLYNATGSVNAHTALSIYGGDIDGEISVGGDAAVIDGDANIWLYDGDFADCTAISGYNGTGDVNVKVKIEEKLASHVYPSTSVSTLPSSLLRTGAADPCLFTFGDTYYLTMTGSSNIALLKSKDLAGFQGMALTPNLVYKSAQDTNAIENLGYDSVSGTWSPEIHYFTEEEFGQNAGWYMYIALRKATGDSSDISMVALKSADGKTPDGPYVHPTSGEQYVSQTILDKNGKPFNEEWGCGMSILRIESGKYAGVYAMWVGEENRGTPAFRQMIWIAKLQSPWQLAGDPAVIMYPTQAWEKLCKGYTNGTYYPEVVEGATAVYGKDGQIYVVYSGGGYWWTYGIGQMTWNGGDPLSASSWIKYENNPTFACNTASGSHYTGLKLQGAGHATYFTDANGQMYAAYHAYPSDANGNKGENPSRNAYLETCYIDYSLHNGVNQGVLLVGNGDGKPANPDEAPAVTVTLEGEGTTVLDLCDENAVPVVFVKLEPPLVTAENLADGSILVTMEDHNPADTTYRISRSVNGSSSFTPVAVVSEKQYIDTDITVGTRYSYLVEPFNENYSAMGWTAAPVTALPAQPTVMGKALIDAVNSTDLILLYTVPDGATCKTTYRVGSGAWTEAASYYNIPNVTAGATYTVRLESVVNVGGVDYFSLPVEFTFTADLPTLTLSDATTDGFTAAWTFPAGVTAPTYMLGSSST